MQAIERSDERYGFGEPDAGRSFSQHDRGDRSSIAALLRSDRRAGCKPTD